MSPGGALVMTLVMTQLMTQLGTGRALLCPRCDASGCRPQRCPSPAAACRRTTLTASAGGRVLRREEGGCDAPGPALTLTLRSHGQSLTLRESRCRGGGQQEEGCDPPGPSPAPQGPALLCPTCDDSDGSCRGPPAALPCPRPTDRCLWLSTRPPGQARAQELRGCGRVGACRALLGLESGNGTRGRHVTVRCCGGGSCPREPDPPPSGLRCWGCDGPEPHGCDPQVLLCRGGLTHCVLARTYGPSGEPWLVRGCASPDWCDTPVGLGGLRGEALPHCCRGALCNRLPGDPPSDDAPRPPGGLATHILLLLLLLLLTAAPHI